jgi:hypothetical protein
MDATEITSGVLRVPLRFSVIPVLGLVTIPYNNSDDVYVRVDFDGNGTSHKVARSDHVHYGAATLAELAALLVEYWNVNGLIAGNLKVYNRTTGLWQNVELEGPDDSPQWIIGPGEAI